MSWAWIKLSFSDRRSPRKMSSSEVAEDTSAGTCSFKIHSFFTRIASGPQRAFFSSNVSERVGAVFFLPFFFALGGSVFQNFGKQTFEAVSVAATFGYFLNVFPS